MSSRVGHRVSSTASSHAPTSSSHHPTPSEDAEDAGHDQTSVGTDPEYPDSRWAIKKNAKGLIAGHKKMSSTITKTFHKFANPTGFAWKLTPDEIKNTYFEEFRKYFSWPPEWETAVREKWEKRARIRYSDMIHDVKELRGPNNSGRPLFISEEMWRGLCAYWDTPEVIARSEAARRCRMSEPDGPGTGYRTHRGGSKSIEILAEEMSAKEGIPLEKCVYPSFRAIHVNKDGTYMSKKAKKIDEKVKAIVAERGEGADVNQIYMEVNREELRKKQRMYGTGSLVSSLMSDASSGGSSSQLHSSRLEEVEKQLQEEREKRQQLEERFLATQEMVQQMAEQLSQHQSHTRTSGDDRRDG